MLEGSVRRADRRLRITVRLTSVEDGSVLWSERYDRELADVFAVQEEIAAAIVAALSPTLLGTAAPGAGHGGALRRAASPATLEAYELYLQGRHCWHQRAPSAMRAGIDCFERAARLDPGFARAYAGIADSYGILRAYGILPWEEGRRSAKLAADRALELDPTLAEAHLSLGMFRFHYEADWAIAEPCFRKAIEINPCSSLAQVYYGLFLAVRGRGEEAPPSARSPGTSTRCPRSRRPWPASPCSSPTATPLPWRWPTAPSSCRPTIRSRWRCAVWRCLKLGRLGEAVTTLERLVQVSRRAPIYVGMLGLAYGLRGERNAALRPRRRDLGARADRGYVSPHAT